MEIQQSCTKPKNFVLSEYVIYLHSLPPSKHGVGQYEGHDDGDDESQHHSVHELQLKVSTGDLGIGPRHRVVTEVHRAIPTTIGSHAWGNRALERMKQILYSRHGIQIWIHLPQGEKKIQ